MIELEVPNVKEESQWFLGKIRDLKIISKF